MSRTIKLYPKNLKGKLGISRFAAKGIKDVKVKQIEDPFHIVLIPCGKMGEFLSQGNLDDKIPESGLPRQIQKQFKKLAGWTFRAYLENFINLVITKSQQIKKTDYEVIIE